MFYGSGAGKLPTASAVVADIVDIAKHLHKNILISWSSRKMELVDSRKAKSCFFVRSSDSEAEIRNLFGDVEFVKAEGISGETGFLTEQMTEEEYEQKAAGLKHILQRIRVV